MKDSLFLRELEVHPDWQSFLSAENRQLISSIEEKVIQSNFTPAPGKVLRFLTLPLVSGKIIILGQDPYPQSGVATGRAFEAGNLKSWNQPFRNVSLKNILRAIYKAYTGEIILFSRLKERMQNNFPVLPPPKLFEYWESQGILLLNTSFSCETGNPGSHQSIWMEFTGLLLQYISQKAPHLTWFIWGNHAAQATKNLELKNRFYSLHPMMCSALPERECDFLYGNQNCFSSFLNEIDWTGYAFLKKEEQQKSLF